MNSSPINVIAVISVFISTIYAEDDILQSHLILSGRTGSGKTKTVKKISDILKQKGIPFSGFYTIDHMIGNSRCGFDMIDLNSNRSAPIARIAYMSETKGPRVGRYVVNLEAFEDFVKSIFSDFEKLPSILLLDEVGKMELESVLFQGILTDLFKMGSQYIIVVSVPERRHDLKVLVNICKMPTSRIIAVNSENRDLLPEMLAKEIIQMHKMITASESSTPMSPTT